MPMNNLMATTPKKNGPVRRQQKNAKQAAARKSKGKVKKTAHASWNQGATIHCFKAEDMLIPDSCVYCGGDIRGVAMNLTNWANKRGSLKTGTTVTL